MGEKNGASHYDRTLIEGKGKGIRAGQAPDKGSLFSFQMLLYTRPRRQNVFAICQAV